MTGAAKAPVMAAAALSKGTPVWVDSGNGSAAWQRGAVVSVSAGTCRVALDCELGQGAGTMVTVPLTAIEPANPTLLDGVSDLTHLSYLNEPGILHVLCQRYAGDTVYTNAGPVLVSVNPFKPLPLYGPDAALHYSQRSSGEAAASYEPHVFLTADQAYKQMVALNQSQSVLITGESGAGKTETTKIVMRYLATLAGGTGMEDRVLETNPILEAFGNAKTIHNNNSSRFGKLIEIYFNRGHSICGALIHTYLLEKSRVVHQQPGERSYHIFYQLCRGASEEERQLYLLPPAGDLGNFAYLSSSGCSSIAGVDDAAEFAGVKRALSAVGIGGEQQEGLFSLLAAILWLGNVQFKSLHDDAVAVDDASMPALRAAAALLRCGEEPLLRALTTRRMLAGGELITRELNMEAAMDNRDALSKALYATLFKWLVEQINAALAVGKQQSETTLSILDIYGFEQFQENSFEQLCINFANERLQQQFSKHMFRLEQDVYECEGIDWAHVEFVDNQDCVDLIEARPPAGVGILSLLDEECMMPRGSDATFASKLQQRHGGHGRFSYNTKAPGVDFTVQHYAGPVTYSAAKFLDKNRDTLSKDLVALLQASSAPLVKRLAEEMERGQERRGSQTVGARFRDQLRDLIQRLDGTALHFVRCIKPNSQQVARTFDSALILHQLRCCGVLEVARIAQAGYPTRYLHHEFAARYKVLLPELGPGPLPAGLSPLDVCQQLLAHFNVDPSQYQIGRTRLFFRTGVLGQLEDAAARMQRCALYIQSTWRMARCRRSFLRSRSAAVAVQAQWRGRLARALFAQLLRQHRAAVCIQAAARGCAHRRRYRRALQGVVAIQMAWRQHVVNKRVAARLAQRRQAEARQRAASEVQRRREETFEAIQRDFGLGAGEIRNILSLWQEHGEAFMQWRQLPSCGTSSQSCGGTTAAAAAAEAGPGMASDDSGVLLEAAAANVDVQQMRQELEGLQGYCHKLERHADDLREENQLLQRAVTTLQQAVDESADPAVASHCRTVLAGIISSSPLKQQGAGQRKAQRPPRLQLPGALPAAEAGQLALSSVGSGRPPRPGHPHFAIHADATSPSPAGGAHSGSLPGEQLDGHPGPLGVSRSSRDARSYVGGDGDGEYEDGDGDTISMMSLNDGDSFTTDSQSLAAAGSTPTPASVAAARAEGGAVVGMLGREFERKRALLDDDVDFIREVGSGVSSAPGMDPDMELQRLVARYKSWKKEFKERLGGTQRVIKQLKREEKRVVGSGSAAGSFTHSAQSGSTGSALFRIDSGARGGGAISAAGSEDGSRTSRASRVLSHFKSRR